jgi:putative NADH-flavin reductase
LTHVLVIGASKGIGLETVKAALAAGHRVRAFSRSGNQVGFSHPSLEIHRGDALNSADIIAALRGVDVVIQTLGVRAAELFGSVSLFSAATRILVPAMEKSGIKRLIALTGFGAGDSQSAISFVERIPFHVVFGRAYADKSIQESLIKESTLDWTIVRPGVLLPGAASHRYKVLAEPAQWRNGAISRADVADFLVKQITATQYIRKAPVLVRW